MHTAITSLWIVCTPLLSLLPFLVPLSLPPTVLWIPQSITGPIALMIFSGRAESASCCPESNKLQSSSFRLSLACLILRGPLLLTGWGLGTAVTSRCSKALKPLTAHSREPVLWMGLCEAGWAHQHRDLDQISSSFYNFQYLLSFNVIEHTGQRELSFSLPSLGSLKEDLRYKVSCEGDGWTQWFKGLFQTEQF